MHRSRICDLVTKALGLALLSCYDDEDRWRLPMRAGISWLSLVGLVVVSGCDGCDRTGLTDIRPALDVDPSSINLTGVPIAQNSRVVVQVSNPSGVNLDEVTGELLDGTDPNITLLEAYIDRILPSGSAELVLNIRPVVVGVIEGQLRVSTTDDASPNEVIVPIRVSSVDAGSPDIEVTWPPPTGTPQPGDEGCLVIRNVGRGDVGRAQLDVSNVGLRDLLINKVSYVADVEGDETVRVANGIDTTPDRALALQPRRPTPLTINVVFRADDTDLHRGKVVFESNDPDENPYEVCVIAQAQACPTAVAELVGREVDEPIEPFDTLRFTGENSVPSSAETEIVAYEWRVLQKPVGSTENIVPADRARTELTLDLGGRWVVGLDVFDNNGIRSCETSELIVDVRPTDDLAIQLVWDANSADYDLHLLREGGDAFTHEGDCYFSNRLPEWDPDMSRNPRLDVDDDDGYGPENLNIEHPAPGSRWVVLVHYWNARAAPSGGASNAILRVFAYGNQIIELVQPFADEQLLWRALEIQWPENDLEPPTLSQLGVVESFPRPF
jgi:hypothetical protein